MSTNTFNELTAHECEICGSNKLIPLGYKPYDSGFPLSKENYYQIFECEVCHLVFTEPKPSHEELERYFKEQYFADRYGSSVGKDLTGFPRANSFAELKMQLKRQVRLFLWEQQGRDVFRIEKLLKKYCTAATTTPLVVEIGGGSFPQTYLTRYGFLYHGVEPSEQTVRAFHKKGYRNIEQGFGEDLRSLEDASVDVFIMLRSLAHVHDLSAVFTEVRRCLRPNGCLLIADENIDISTEAFMNGPYAYYGFHKAFFESGIKDLELVYHGVLDAQLRWHDVTGNKFVALLRRSLVQGG